MTNHRYLETNQEISEDTVCAIIILDKIIVTSVTVHIRCGPLQRQRSV